MLTGAENLAKAANAVDADFLQISTNYVFDGKLSADSFYTLKDIPDPINVYGRTKLAGRARRACCIAPMFYRPHIMGFRIGQK